MVALASRTSPTAPSRLDSRNRIGPAGDGLPTGEAGFTTAPVHVALLDKGQRSVKGLNSGSEGVVTVDLVLTVRKEGSGDHPAGGRPLSNEDAERLVRDAVAEMPEAKARNPSYVYAHILTKAIRDGLLLDGLHLSDVLVALRQAGYRVDGKTGELLRGGLEKSR